MSFTDEGYIKDTIDEIVNRIVGRLLDTYPTLSLDPSNWIYQLVKVVALEVLYQENIVENAIANMTVMGASGVFLDYHGAENGIFRKSAEYAIGYINPTSESRTADTTVYIPEGTTFSTVDGKEFITLEEVGFVHEIPMTHTSGGIGSKDTIPSYYIDFSVDKILTSGDVEITATYTITDQILEWTQDPGLSPGVSYKIIPDHTKPYTLSIYSKASEIGTAGNAGIGTITVNTESAQWVNSVTNLAAFTGGINDESDSDFRYRIFQSRRRHFTFDNIRDLVNNIDGVDDCRVYQTVVPDIVLQNPWNPTGNMNYRLDNSILTDSYAVSNQDTDEQVGNGTITASGQSFTGDGNILSTAKLWLKSVGTLTGYAVCKIYASTGSDPSRTPTGSALATSVNVQASNIGSSYQMVNFDFNDEFTLVDGTKYFIVLEYTKDSSNYLVWGSDRSSTPSGDNFATYSGSWSAVSAADACYYIYTKSSDSNEYNILIVNFVPSQYIGTLKGITIHAKCHKVTKVPDLYVYMVTHGEDGFTRPDETHLADTIVDYGDMIDVGLDTYRDVFITLPYNGMDYSNTYRLYFYSPNADIDNYWTFDTNVENTDIDNSWRTAHKKMRMQAQYASGTTYTGTAATAVDGDSWNGTGDTIIRVQSAIDTDCASSGTVTIGTEECEYSSYSGTDFTLSSALIEDHFAGTEDVVVTDMIYNGTGDSKIKVKVAPTDYIEPGVVSINGDLYDYDTVSTNYFNLSSTNTLTANYSEDDVVLYPGTESSFGDIDEVITLKTYFGANAYTISVIPEEGVNFEDDLKPEIETLVNYEDGGGYSPVCVQVNIEECTKVEMDINSAILSIEDGYVFDSVLETVKTNISNYLSALHPGDDVVYSQIEKAILISAGVYRVRELEIEIEGETADKTTEYDLRISDNNYVVLGSSLSFTEE